MAKMLKTAGIVVAAVALVAMTAGAAAPAVAATATTAASAGGVAGVSAATLGAIGAYGGLASAALTAAAAATAPGVSAQGTATKFVTNPDSGLPYAMGRTRMSGLRFFAGTNTRPGYTKFNDLLWFGALLSIGGQIDSIEKFTADGEVVAFDASGNAVGEFRDYMAQKVHLGGPMATALNLSLGGGTAPGWTTAHKLSGITHAMWCLRYNKQGEMYGAGAPEPAWIGKWVKVYDPRLDSTYPGGSGACRALQESTYVWSDNPGLHALTWALGRWQNGNRTCGIGAPVETIRMAEFVECANVCDANGWKVGGVEWTTDSKWDTLKRILQAGGARPTQTAAMVGCLVNMPRTAIATIESRHLHDGLSLAATKSRRERINTVLPRYVDENSDWSVITGTAVSVAQYITADKGKRSKEIDFPLVQVFSGEEAKQPGQLAAYEIVNSREAGPWTFTTGPEWIGLKTGDVVYLNVPEEGLVNQPVMITRRAIDPSTGKVSFAVETETYSKHAYALGESTTPPDPFTLAAPDLKPPAPVATEWSVSGTTSGEGFPALLVAGDSEMPSADAIVIDYRLHTTGESAGDGWTNSAILSAVDTVRHVIAPLESQTAYDVRISYRVGTIDGDTTIFEQVVTGVGKITIIEGQLQDQDEALAQLDEDIAQAEINIAAAQQTIAGLQADAAATETALTQAQDDILAQGAEIQAAQGDIIANATAISTVSGTVSSQGASITSLQQTASGQAGQISTLQQTVSTHGGSISSNATAITNLQGSVSSLSQTVSTQGSTISQNSTAITTLQGNYASLSSTVSAQGSSITQLQTASSTQAGQIANLTTSVTASGNVNLLPNGGFENGSAGWVLPDNTVATGDSTYGTLLFMDFSAGTTNRAAYQDISGSIPGAGAAIVVSADARSGALDGNARVDILFLDASGAQIGSSNLNSKSGVFGFDDSNAQRGQLANTGIVPANTATLRVRCRGQVTSLGAGKTISFRLVKLERGSQWTPFTANASIVQSFTALATLNTQYASLSTTVSTQGSAIATQAMAITTLQSNVATLTTRVSAGGVNLLPNGGLEDGFNSGVANAGNFTLVNSARWGRYAQVTATGTQAFHLGPVAVAAGGTYTLSCDPILFGGASTGYVDVVGYNSSGTLVYDGPQSTLTGPFDFDTTTGRRSQIAITFTIPSDVATIRCRFVCNVLAGTTCGFRQMKLEIGSQWTPYSNEASVIQSFQALSTLTTQYASLSTTVSTQGVTITSQQTAITTINGNVTALLGKAGVTVDVNGYMTGWALNNNGNAGSFVVNADNFAILKPGGGMRTEYSGGNWRVYDSNGVLRGRWGIW
ncbi:putative tail protein [Novosphingobium sp. PhB55]|uniref:phage tail protein n=1 Tax=Novosphingobium sp. PhB55 TaxID=2485106 RepID=UPI0010671789|nr:phage tail protein [Novosphingobium sp. PhB55]TDW65344.1 putative tail protein [Novosphingobium sp. PhB55]